MTIYKVIDDIRKTLITKIQVKFEGVMWERAN